MGATRKNKKELVVNQVNRKDSKCEKVNKFINLGVLINKDGKEKYELDA